MNTLEIYSLKEINRLDVDALCQLNDAMNIGVNKDSAEQSLTNLYKYIALARINLENSIKWSNATLNQNDNHE